MVYLFGLWLTAMVPLFSSFLNNAISVAMGTGSIVIASYALGIFPNIKSYVPTYLLSAQALLVRAGDPEDYLLVIVVTSILVVVSFVLGWVIFDRRRL